MSPEALSTRADCPECDADVPVPADAVVGEILSCPECTAELELVGLAPASVALAPDVDEDWGE